MVVCGLFQEEEGEGMFGATLSGVERSDYSSWEIAMKDALKTFDLTNYNTDQ